MDPGETVRSGAQREVLEEAGVGLRAKSLSYLFSFQPERGHEVHVFAARLSRRPAVGPGDGEHDTYTWAKLDRLPRPGIPHFRALGKAVSRLLAQVS